MVVTERHILVPNFHFHPSDLAVLHPQQLLICFSQASLRAGAFATHQQTELELVTHTGLWLSWGKQGLGGLCAAPPLEPRRRKPSVAESYFRAPLSASPATASTATNLSSQHVRRAGTNAAGLFSGKMGTPAPGLPR